MFNCLRVSFPSDACVLKASSQSVQNNRRRDFVFLPRYVRSVEEFSQLFTGVNVLHERGGAAHCVSV